MRFLLTIVTAITMLTTLPGTIVDNWGNEIPGIITNDTWMSPMPTYVYGKMVFYGPAAMDATAEYRGIDYKVEGCIGGISLMSPYNIGDKAWIFVNDEWFGPFCVVDCARRGDMYSIVTIREEVVEVNFDFAQQIGMVGPSDAAGNFEVYDWFRWVFVMVNIEPETFFEDYCKMDPCLPIIYKDYFLDHVEFATGWQPRVILTQDGLWKLYNEDVYYLKPEDKLSYGSLELWSYKGERFPDILREELLK